MVRASVCSDNTESVRIAMCVCIHSFERPFDLNCHCRLLMTSTNSLALDQDGENVGPDLDPNCLTLMVFQKYIRKKDP